MTRIESLNAQYVNSIKSVEVLRHYTERINATTVDNELTELLKAVNSVMLLSNLSKEFDCSKSDILKDTVLIGNQFLACINAIDTYKTTLLQSSITTTSRLSNALNQVRQAQEKYDELKANFLQKYNSCLDSPEALNLIVLSVVTKALSKEQDTVKQLKNEAKNIIAAENTTEIRRTDPITTNDTLPTDLLIAKTPVQSNSMQVLHDIGITNTYQNVFLHMRDQGNVMVSSDFEHVESRRLDEFIIAYILRFIASFPLGVVNVHIFSQNINYLYKRLYNSFQSEKYGENAKKTIQIHSSLSDLAVLRDVNCEDIFKKTSVLRPDLYSIYEDDRSDPFNLIIIRDGLLDGNGYASADILETINALTKPGETGHKCGLRFLIVDNSTSFEKSLSSSNKHYLSSIQQNCALRIQFNDKTGFSLHGKPIEMLHVSGNLDVFIQERSMVIAEAINSKEKNYISLEDVSAKEPTNQLGNIMYIPVGKSGGNIVELPLSCRDEDGTIAGQCIGYIAIGQSGSGKSSFFHSLVLNGCMKYAPKDLQFWLLDFKNGGASSKYSDCGIPHIKIIAENNKIDDALCLFQMVLEEMERRTKAFNQCFTDNIIEYNKKAISEGLEYFPRIVIAIDEVQEIFREDNASVLQKLISSISTRMRSAGMHFVMVAQNLSEGKSYMLKEAFMPSATGRICFRVSQDIPRDSGFEDDFIQRKQEISELKTGEAYVSYGKGTIKKVKMAFVSSQDMSQKVFAEIRDKYPEYAYLKPRVIGSKARLSIISSMQGVHGTYKDALMSVKHQGGVYEAVLGEDVYRMSPFHIQLSQHENSSIFLFGSDKQMASSLCTSIALSLLRQNVQVHLFNGDRSKYSDGYESVPHPFMYLCQNISAVDSKMQNHRLDQLKDVLEQMYSEYLDRQAMVQKTYDEDPTFPAIILIVNDLFGIESFINNEIVESNVVLKHDPTVKPGGFNLNFDIFSDQMPASSQTEGRFREGCQNILSTIIKNGHRYNLHVVLAIKGDPSIWRTGRSIAGINNIMLFNDTEYADQIENSYYLKEMLKNISNDNEAETVAVWASRKTFSKVRPILYKMTDLQEKSALQSLITD